MKKYTLTGSVVAVFLGITMIQGVSSQQFDLEIPCSNEMLCKDPRLPENARCVAGHCICPSPTGEPKTCLLLANETKSTVHNPAAVPICKGIQDCKIANSFCNTTRQQCECVKGYVKASSNWICLPVARSMGSNCEDDKQCLNSMPHTICSDDKQCICANGYHFNNETCFKSIGFGDTCSKNEECSHVTNAECLPENVCGCSPTSVLNSDGRRCLPVAKELLEPCIETAQCSKNFMDSECIDKRCECRENNHFVQLMSRCVPSKNLGDTCAADYECYQDQILGPGQPQKCSSDNVCICSDTFVQEEGKCVTAGASSIVPGIFLIVFFAGVLSSRS